MTDTPMAPADRAVAHILDLVESDANLLYLIGPGSGTYRLLIEAEAVLLGIDPDVALRRRRGRLTSDVPEIVRQGAELDRVHQLIRQAQRDHVELPTLLAWLYGDEA